ncbi:DUF6686 family protein [Chondrinema litorale]|uniref:DUF6686 family protein n=1 Tax=Chondrinema litorale TaxID=2994555 RepID=UPI002543A115|nr:DUF6686 family protein [Chondrinema litorale]UZR99456.1 hypothetical protein OQ292_36925 [Chondrinema litorale]
MSCIPEILLEGNYFNIARCRHCKRIGLYYKNLLVGFTPEAFEKFSDAFVKLNFQKMALKFPDGHKHIIINTCHHDIQLNFIEKEFDEMKEMLEQASVLLEAKDVLDNYRKK